MARLLFPENLQDPQHLHWMNINCFEQGNYSDTITLFVPGGGQNGSMSWEHAHDYTDAKLARVAAGMLGIGAGAGVIPGMSGKAINPFVEVLYRNTDLRKFQFNFLFAPTSEKESKSMEQIFKTLRYHSAPKMLGGYSNPEEGYRGDLLGQYQYLTTGALWDAPSEFTISFYYNGKLNPYVPKIGRSIIERIDVNYTPLGEFSTFSNGHPVSAMLTVVFKELRVIDKQNIQKGY